MAGTPNSSDKKMRLDLLLTQAGHFETRARARDAIARGAVSVDGRACRKPGARFSGDVTVNVNDAARPYVSRAALKLIAGLDAFDFDPSGRTVLDAGASTGGFSQVLLERGAEHVIAVDVGHGQLHPSLRGNPRVSNHEGVNARFLAADIGAGQPVEAVVSDVSFISLKLALPPALALAAGGSFCVLLVKPQFEAGRSEVSRGRGVISDPDVRERVRDEVAEALAEAGCDVLGWTDSPITGADGNHEFLVHAVTPEGSP